MKIIRVLWIEDDAARQFDYLATPVILDGRFDLIVAISASEGMAKIYHDGPFDVVIVDVRLPAGEDLHWRDIAHKHGDREDPRLGLEVLRQTLSTKPSLLRANMEWVVPSRFGILTVENSLGAVKECMEETGVNRFKSKTVDQGERVLLSLIEEVMLDHK